MNPIIQVVCSRSRKDVTHWAPWRPGVATSLLVCWLPLANAQITVTDDGFSFSPDPVSVQVGDSVAWVDDGTGPYQIISDTGGWTTFKTPGRVAFTQVGTFPYHDDAGDFGTIYVSLNVPPSVAITNPAPNTLLSAPAFFVFGADASDTDSDGLSNVQFFVGTNLVDDVFSSPFTTMVSNLTAGTYTLTAVAIDNGGATATNSITITVSNQPALAAPRILAGQFVFVASGLIAGKTNVLLTSTNLTAPIASWARLSTNVAKASMMSFTNAQKTSAFFRLLQLP